MRPARVVVIMFVIGCLILSVAAIARAEQASFSLARGQSITVGGYILRYTGLTNGWPSYQLAGGGALFAVFPSNPLPATCCEYTYGSVSVVTTGVAPDGTAVTGTITVR
jgi:hypothetical protein